jgi:predicted transcriptional regulator
MPISLRIPSEKEKMINRAASKEGKTKTAFILEAVYEKLGLAKARGDIIRELSGWLSHEEAGELRKSVEIFGKVNEEDWH